MDIKSYRICCVTNKKFPILSNFTCNSENVIYCITCTTDNENCKTNPQYFGQTGHKAVERYRNSIEQNSVKQNYHKPCH